MGARMARFVLIPGAWLGAWTWKKVAPILWKEGHPSIAVTLTGMGERVHLAGPQVGMETAIEDTLNVIKFNELKDVTLVGHSFAGKVAAAVADRAPENVHKVVYLDAFRPERTTEPQGGFDPTREFGPTSPGSHGVPFSEEILTRIGPDVKGADRAWMLSMATPWPVRLAKDPITLSRRYDSVKEAYVFCSQSGDPVDEIVAGKWGKLDGPHTVLDAGHWPMVTTPEQLAKDLITLSK